MYKRQAIACLLIYLAIAKKFEPLLLLPIGFGMLLANIPSADLKMCIRDSVESYLCLLSLRKTT